MKTPASFILFCLGIAASAPSDGLEGAFPTPSAKTLGHGRMLAGVSVFGHNNAGAVKDKTFLMPNAGTGRIDSVLFQDLVSIGVRPALGFGIGNYFDATLSIPLYSDLLSESGAKELSGTAQGDLKATVKIGAPFRTEVAAVALVLEATAPTGATKGFLPKGSELIRPVDSLNGLFDNEATFSAKSSVQSGWGLFTLDLNKLEETVPIRFGFGLGYLTNPGSLGGPRARGYASFEWIPVPRLGIFAMVATQASVNRFQGFGDFKSEDMRLTTGVAVRSEEGLFVDAGLQFRLSDENHLPYAKPYEGSTARYQALAVPALQIGLRFGWTGSLFQTDKDGDGISDKIDACPKAKEDMDGFQDADGCPEPDNDDDSIRDEHDKCPLQAEDFDKIQDEDGCPETDADQDGVNDEDDRCPSEPEDRDGVSDMDGCPDLDNDQDNVLDAQDRCPMEPEDKDGFQDADGCPDPDNDTDGISDSLDKCPNEAENRNGFEDADGCPEAALPSPTVEIAHHGVLSDVQFQGRTALLTPGSYAALDSLAADLKILTRARLEIRVYTDDRGTGRDLMKLTQARADAVVRHLALKGVERTRLTARGMGSKSPVASNRTPQGRRQNRRVEFQRVD